MLVEMIVGGLVITAAYKVSTSQKGVLTKQRLAIYNAAMNKQPPLPPEQMRALADTFDSQGLGQCAIYLRKRADVRDLPADKKLIRQQAIQRIMASDDSHIIRVAAQAFEAEASFGTAKTLRDLADGLDAAALQAILAQPMPPASAPVKIPAAPMNMPISQEPGAVQGSSPESSTPSTPAQSAAAAATPDPAAVAQEQAAQRATIAATPVE